MECSEQEQPRPCAAAAGLGRPSPALLSSGNSERLSQVDAVTGGATRALTFFFLLIRRYRRTEVCLGRSGGGTATGFWTLVSENTESV